jgi:hypothetical protein
MKPSWTCTLTTLIVPVILASAASATSEEAKLLASDGATGDLFGWAVSLDGTTAILGAMHDDDNGSSSGSAYVFVNDGTTWTEEAKLIASDGAILDLFGISVAVNGDTAVVGSMNDEGGDEAGAVYVFVRSGGNWTQQAKILADDTEPFGRFGGSLFLAGDTLLVGSDHKHDSGSAYVFVRSGTSWTQQAKLTPADGAIDDYGISVSLSGDTAVVGSPHADAGGETSGAVYAFVRNGTTWTQQAKLTADDGEEWDLLGRAVSVHDDTIVAGALGAGPSVGAGAAYVFVRNGTDWTQEAKLLPNDGEWQDTFGFSVSVHGDNAVIGTPGDDDDGTDSGSAYVFSRNGTGWTQGTKLIPSDGVAQAGFGMCVSLRGETAIAGSPSNSELGVGAGAAYVFHVSSSVTDYGFGVGCPCNNDDPGAGCRNATGSGASLIATGSTGVTADDLVLTVESVQGHSFGMIYMGPDEASIPFGDGLRVVQPGPPGGFCRFPVHLSDSSGSYAEGPGIVETSENFGCGPIQAGERWNFQGYYRDAGGPCGSGFNLTNGVSVLFGI